MGAVYKGRPPALDRPVAIKLLPAEIAADKQFISRFRREARILAKLQHSGIRDIKPGNILVATDGRVKLTDFGLARPIKEEVPCTPAGTSSWAPPITWLPSNKPARATSVPTSMRSA